MLTIETLKAYGADTKEGLSRCFNNETFYLALVEMLLHDERFETLGTAVKNMDAEPALHAAHALSDTASGLALNPLAAHIEQMILCLRVPGDSAVLDKQMGIITAHLEQLRQIDMI